MFVFALECVAVNNIVFMIETVRQCSVSRLVLYCVRVCVLVLGVECVTVSSVVFMGGKDRQCSVAALGCIV